MTGQNNVGKRFDVIPKQAGVVRFQPIVPVLQ
jgi:hypothetical protein